MTTAPVAANDNVRQFYVYQHRRNDTGRVFYIGKGSGDRAWDGLHRRDYNAIWKGCAKNGYTVEIVCDGLDEKHALELEVMLIQFHGRRDIGTGYLANLTDGGEGGNGAVRSVESRERYAAAKRGRARPQFSDEWRAALTHDRRMRGPKTGLKGVSFNTRDKAWIAQLKHCGVKLLHSYHKTPEEAARAYDVAAVAAWGAGNCYLNFPAEHLQAA